MQESKGCKKSFLGMLITFLLLIPGLALAVPAFPGAEGFGAKSVGGRGGKVIEVTNLNDSGSGSLRAAIAASGPRTVVFRVGGTIELKSRIQVENPYLTIAGQTAPGGGITLKNGSNEKDTLYILTHDVVVRYLRVRPGPGGDADGVGVGTNASNVVLDHCSVSWAVDENLGVSSTAKNVSIQWSIIAEGL